MRYNAWVVKRSSVAGTVFCSGRRRSDGPHAGQDRSSSRQGLPSSTHEIVSRAEQASCTLHQVAGMPKEYKDGIQVGHAGKSSTTY